MRFPWTRALAGVAAALLVASPALAVEIFVDKSYAGNDSDGSQDKPYKTIQAAVDVIPGSGTHEIYIRVVPTGGNTEVETIYEEQNGVVVAAKNIKFSSWLKQGQTQGGRVIIRRPDVPAAADPPGGDGGDGQPTFHVKTAGRVELRQAITIQGPRGGDGAGIAYNGGKGGAGIQADDDGGTKSVIVLSDGVVKCIGGNGGHRTNGGKAGSGGPGEFANGGKIVDANGKATTGGKAGSAGLAPQDSRIGGPSVMVDLPGDGGPGARAANGGIIEIDDASVAYGGAATEPGGQAGPDLIADGSSSIIHLADGSYCLNTTSASPSCAVSPCSEGSCVVVGVALPAAASWGLGALALMLGLAGWTTLRSRRLSARAA